MVLILAASSLEALHQFAIAKAPCLGVIGVGRSRAASFGRNERRKGSLDW